MNSRLVLAGGVSVGFVAWLVWQCLPQPYADRLARIPETSTHIDNVRPYDAAEKWERNGSQAGLHLLNPSRVAYFDKTVRLLLKPPFRVLDVGCGGGLVSNALGKMDGYSSIDGVDLSYEALHYASNQAKDGNLTHVNFHSASVYSLPFQNDSFNVVVISDVLEHLVDLVGALKEVSRVLQPNGVLVFDTINRSLMAYLVAIVGAEYVVRIISKGSHDWRLFVRPVELHQALKLAGFHGFTHHGFDPSFKALLQLSLFSMGLMRAEDMQGDWRIEPPSAMMISYIGHATRLDGTN